MEFPIRTLTPKQYPESLKEIPQVPKKLYLRGAPIDAKKRMIAVIGARQHTAYGQKSV